MDEQTDTNTLVPVVRTTEQKNNVRSVCFGCGYCWEAALTPRGSGWTFCPKCGMEWRWFWEASRELVWERHSCTDDGGEAWERVSMATVDKEERELVVELLECWDEFQAASRPFPVPGGS